MVFCSISATSNGVQPFSSKPFKSARIVNSRSTKVKFFVLTASCKKFCANGFQGTILFSTYLALGDKSTPEIIQRKAQTTSYARIAAIRFNGSGSGTINSWLIYFRMM